jgi:hypothetical protein
LTAISSELGWTDGTADAIVAADALGVAIVVAAGVAAGTGDVVTGGVPPATLHAPIEVATASSDARTSQDFGVEPFMLDAPRAMAFRCRSGCRLGARSHLPIAAM